MIRSIFALGLAAALSTAVPGQATEREWPRPEITTKGGILVVSGWTETSPGRWTADPADAAAPRIIDLEHQGDITGREGFAEALRTAGIANGRNLVTVEAEAYSALVNEPGRKGWASAGEAVVSGVDQSLFAFTAYSKKGGLYDTTLFIIPKKSLVQWGGPRIFADAFGLSEHIERLPADFWEIARDAGPRDQATIFAGLLDVTITRIAMQGLAIQQQTLNTLQAIGKDLATERDCIGVDGCTYTPGGEPGQGKATYGPR